MKSIYMAVLFLVYSCSNLVSMNHSRSSSVDSMVDNYTSCDKNKHVTEKQIYYQKLLVDMFGISEQQAIQQPLFIPMKSPWSNMELNFAVQARKLTKVTQILRSQPIWQPKTVLEALALMDSPYIICAELGYDARQSDPIKQLLVQTLPAKSRK